VIRPLRGAKRRGNLTGNARHQQGPVWPTSQRHCEEGVSQASERRGNPASRQLPLNERQRARGPCDTAVARSKATKQSQRERTPPTGTGVAHLPTSLRGVSEPSERTTRQSGLPTAAPQRATASGRAFQYGRCEEQSDAAISPGTHTTNRDRCGPPPNVIARRE